MKRYTDFLIDNGWQKTRNVSSTAEQSFYKIVDTKTCCQLNKRDGIQVIINCFDFSKYNQVDKPFNFEIELTAEPKDGVWINFKVYTIVGDDLFEQLDNQIEKILCAWEAIN